MMKRVFLIFFLALTTLSYANLRNEYKNGLLFCDYYPTPDFKQDKYNKGLEPEINLYLTKEGKTTKSTVLNKIRFRIDPLKIIVNGDKTYIWHQSFIDLETNKLYLNYEEAKGTLSERIKHTPHAPGDVIFQIHFEKKVSRDVMNPEGWKNFRGLLQ